MSHSHRGKDRGQGNEKNGAEVDMIRGWLVDQDLCVLGGLSAHRKDRTDWMKNIPFASGSYAAV